jgi:hypothetical protein
MSQDRLDSLVWKAVFLARLAETGVVTAAARAAGITTRHAYYERKRNETFAQAWADALESSVEDLEAHAHERARESDSLLMFLLKAHRPEKYRDRTDAAASPPLGVTLTDEQLRDPHVARITQELLAYLAGRAPATIGPGLVGERQDVDACPTLDAAQ